MTDFKIRRGLSSQLSDPRLALEEGCWYLCTDTVELFLCVEIDGKLELKRINGSNSPVVDPDTGLITVTKVEINTAGELIVVYANGDSQILGKVLNTEEPITDIRVGEQVLSPINGLIELPDFAEKSYVDSCINDLNIPTKTSHLINDSGYITADSVENFATKSFVTDKIAEAQLGGSEGSVNLSEYVTKTAVKDYIPEEYITETELSKVFEAIILHGGNA